MSNKRPVPLLKPQGKVRKACPVCGMVSYSVGGVHPQCAKTKADASRAPLRGSPTTSEKPRETAPIQARSAPWHRLCPKCHAMVHIRKTSCDCGHRFS